jgi:hypothetical protein
MAEPEVDPAGLPMPTAAGFESIQGQNILAGQQVFGGTVTNNFHGGGKETLLNMLSFGLIAVPKLTSPGRPKTPPSRPFNYRVFAEMSMSPATK